MEKTRIAHIITNLALGGAQDYMFEVVRGLDLSRFRPYVVGRLEGEWTGLAKSLPGIKLIDLPALRREISPIYDLKSILEIRKVCVENQFDIIHTHSSKPGVVGRIGAWLAGVPVIVHTVHGFSFHDFMPTWNRVLYIILERAMSPFTSSLVVLSKGDFNTAKRYRIGAKGSLENIYYGIDFSPFDRFIDRKSVRQRWGFDDEHFVIGFTGRFAEQKGLHILMEAFARVAGGNPNARLLLVGDGELRSRLEAQASRLGVDNLVTITGFCSDIPALLKAMDCFVMTSLWEGLSRSLAEAMYAQLPVIATDVGGTSDAVRTEETGWLIKPNDVSAAEEAICQVLANKVLAKQKAMRGYDWAREAFDPKKMSMNMEALYDRLLINRMT